MRRDVSNGVHVSPTAKLRVLSFFFTFGRGWEVLGSLQLDLSGAWV